MAGTINVTAAIQHTNGTQSVPLPNKTVVITQTNQGAFTDTQSVGTSYAALTTGSVGTFGVAAFENIDDTNYIEIGLVVSGTFYPFLKLLPGERWLCRLSAGIGLYGKANTAAVKLQKTIYEN